MKKSFVVIPSVRSPKQNCEGAECQVSCGIAPIHMSPEAGVGSIMRGISWCGCAEDHGTRRMPHLEKAALMLDGRPLSQARLYLAGHSGLPWACWYPDTASQTCSSQWKALWVSFFAPSEQCFVNNAACACSVGCLWSSVSQNPQGFFLPATFKMAFPILYINKWRKKIIALLTSNCM